MVKIFKFWSIFHIQNLLFGTALLKTIVSYKLLPSLSHETEKPFLQHFLRHQQHKSHNVYIFLNFELQLGKSKEFKNEKIKKAFKSYFLQFPILVCGGAFIPYFKTNPTIFSCPLISGNYLNLQVRIKKMVSKYTVNWHPSPL